ncbi:MAG: sugar nucleotide-binding protein [Ferroplasma sp.]|uniref:sugar nucleotide-binding protein n=1 Tax=Ferroplasma sp. TaxID=2591003 RepID=UPI002815B576|nr:sugar nucleotide-binding protein [Ferroplasma sp.]WMT52045.1 MAG: sugar nucleotide-binding protein [Ferroplasma sp.]
MKNILLLDGDESFGFRFAKDFSDIYKIHLLFPREGFENYLESIMALPDNFDYIINNFNVPFYSPNRVYMNMLDRIQEIINSRFSNGKKILISTQMVYASSPEPKTEKSITVPETEFGKIMLKSEKLVKDNEHYIIIRSGMVYGKCTYNIYTDILTAIRGNIPLKLDNQVILNPVLNSDLSMIVERSMDNIDRDIINVAGDDAITLYQFGKHLYNSIHDDECPFKGVKNGGDLNYSMDSSRIRKMYKIKFTGLEDIDFLNFVR